MSLFDDIGSWVGGLFDSGSSSDLGSALSDGASSAYDSGGDAIPGSIGSGASDLSSGLSSDLASSLGTSPSIDSILARAGVGNGGVGETASSAYDSGGDGVPGSIGSSSPAPVSMAGAPQATSTIAHAAGNAAASANASKSLIQRLLSAATMSLSATPADTAALMQTLGLIGALTTHRNPPTASQLQSSLANPLSQWTPSQQASFDKWANQGPRVYVPPVYGHKNGGRVGALDCLRYADGGAVPGAMGGPQTMPMAPGAGAMGAPSGPPMGPQSLAMQARPGVMPIGPGAAGPGAPGGGMNPVQAWAATHPNFNGNLPHANFANTHPNFMANRFPGYGGGPSGPGAAPGMGGTGMPLNPGGGMATPGGGGGAGPLQGPMPGGGPMQGAQSFAMPTMPTMGGTGAPPMAAYADGGGVPMGGAFSGYVQGTDSGQSDLVPIRVSPGEYVFDADSVAALGDGNNAAGAALLDRMREKIRAVKRAAPPTQIPAPLTALAQQGAQGPQGQ